MNHQIENLKNELSLNQKEIQTLQSKCEELMNEKLRALDELSNTQLMSEEQLGKLFNLEEKQDLLEVENSRIRKFMQLSNESNKELGSDLEKYKDRIAKLTMGNNYKSKFTNVQIKSK